MTPPSGEWVSAELVETPRRLVWVRLWEISKGSMVMRYEIESSTGYRAFLPACTCEREPCTKPLDQRAQHAGMSVNKWLTHVRTHCHAWHLAQAEKFLQAVCGTYR